MALELVAPIEGLTVGDAYAGPLSVVVVDGADDEPVDLTGAAVEAWLTGVDGVRYPGTVAIVDPIAGALSVTWAPAVDVTPAGIWALDVKIATAALIAQASWAFVVDVASGLTLEQARAEWRDAPDNDVTLRRLLDVALEQVVEYGPRHVADEIAAGGPIPSRYVQAQLSQARNLLNSARMNPEGAIGGDGFSFSPFPLDWVIRQTIRPKRGKAVIR